MKGEVRDETLQGVGWILVTVEDFGYGFYQLFLLVHHLLLLLRVCQGFLVTEEQD